MLGLAELFTDDCVVGYGPGVAPPARGRVAFRAMFGLPGGGFAATSHHNADVLVTFEDDHRASVRTSVYAWHQRADGTMPLPVLGVVGWDVEWHPAIEER